MLASPTLSPPAIGGFSFSMPPSPFYALENKQPKSSPISLGPSIIKPRSSTMIPAAFSQREPRLSALPPKANLKTTDLISTIMAPKATVPQPLTPSAPTSSVSVATAKAKPTPAFPFSAPPAQVSQEPKHANVLEAVEEKEEEQGKHIFEEGEKIPEQIQQFEQCLHREVQLLEMLKQHFLAGPQGEEGEKLTEQLSASKLGEELRAIMESKRVALSALMPSLHDNDNKMKEQLTRVLGKLPQTNMENVMSITSQPAEVAVANRYLLPVPEVTIAPTFRGTENGTSLIVSVKLFYHGSGKEVATTMQGKQEILQGIKRVNVDKNGKATFGKLKVMEVSSKHRHQSFCLAFYLEEYSAQGNKRILTHVKSTPFHVQSRPAKRKRDLGEPTVSPEEEEAEECAQKKQKKEAKKKCLEEEGDRTPASMQDCNYIDITDLLTLPQKEAARRLGISESMLCKRFKECTRRKWPYRYLRKIDKVINMLNLHKCEDGTVPREDQEKLQRLNKEREECLRPVRIRITSYDRMSPMMRLRSRAADYDEEEIPIDALETLEMLKSSVKPSSPGKGESRREKRADSKKKGEDLLQLEDEQVLMMEENSNSESEEMQECVPEGADDDDMNDQSSSSDDLDMSENVKEESISLFEFGKICSTEETRSAIEQMVDEREPTSPPSDTTSSD